jgi:putative transposase
MNINAETFNSSIAIMLRSYTRAINKQENRTGSLFKPHTKAECIDCFKGVVPSYIKSNLLINNHLSDKQYPEVCFNYIHQNPVKAKLVKMPLIGSFHRLKIMQV